VRLNHLALGNFGDCEPVGEGVLELGVHVGPGFAFIARHGRAVMLLLTGGDKSSQRAPCSWTELTRSSNNSLVNLPCSNWLISLGLMGSPS
jgi:putative component of toxin-antitoxin plasmid stabilization module